MIEIEKLEKDYRTGFAVKPKPVLKGVSLCVDRGEICGFIGPNGAGKSTTIKVLLGLLRPGRGKVQLLGKAPGHLDSRKRLGYLPEHPYFYDYLTGRELLRYYGKLAGLRATDLDCRIDEALQRVRADKEWIDKLLRTYSKGMTQRVGLAQAILGKPELLILDEPMSGLDPLGRADVRDTILDLNREEGTTIFYSSHVLSDVEAISTRIHMIVNGRVIRSGSVEEIVGADSSGYRVKILPGENFERELPEVSWDGTVLCCKDAAAKNRLLFALQEAGVGIDTVEALRPSLEEVLKEEIRGG